MYLLLGCYCAIFVLISTYVYWKIHVTYANHVSVYLINKVNGDEPVRVCN